MGDVVFGDYKKVQALKNIRLKSYSYKTNGYYFVTICTDHRKPFLADKIKFVVAQFIEPSCRNRPDKIGATTNRLINQATTSNVKEFLGMKGVYVDYYEIVPTHMHIIIILEGSTYSLSEVIRRFKAKTTLEVARFIGQKGFKLWQPNYYEHIIRTEKALQKIREYIRNNPLKEKIDLSEIYDKDADKSADTE